MAKRVWLVGDEWLYPKQLAELWGCCAAWAVVRANRTLKFKYVYPKGL